VNTDRALSGEAGHRGVRALLGDGRAALHDTLESMVGPDHRLRSFRLRRAKFKPGRKLTALYDVALEDVAQPTPVAVTWFAGGAPASSPQLAAAEQRIRDEGAFTRFDRLWATDASSGMVVLASPLDPGFPSLGRLSDPRNVPATLALCGALDGARPDQYVVRLIRYRPGQRHVLEYRGPGGIRVFAKLYRPGGAKHVAESVTAFAELLDVTGVPGVRAVRPAAVLGDADAVLFSQAAGTPLSRSLRAGHAAGPDQLREVGRMVRAVHSAVPAPSWRFRERDLDGEVGAVLRACEAMIGLKPELGAVAVSIVERARESLEALEQDAVTVVHGDLKADHLLLGRDGIAVLDTDRSGLADPALDIGKLLADLRWWSWVSAGPDSAASEAYVLDGYGAAGPRLARARLYAALLLVRMAARRIPVAARDWAPRTAGLLAIASRAVSERTAW
jgi:aminoglycoside phosphotransferase (APT) family kinase protein